MELRDYTPDEIEALVNEIELGAMRRDTGVDPSIPQYDAPREVPSLRNDQSILGDYINSLESQALERQKHLKSDGRSPMRRFGEYVVYGAPEYDGAEETMTDSLALAPVRMAYQGAVSAKEGVEEGKPLKALGGTGMMAASVLPLSGPLASKLFSSIPRGFASGAAISASPMLAEEALNASPAYAEGEIGLGEELSDKAKKYGIPFAAGMLGGGLSAVYTKTALRNASVNAQREMADLDRIATNRGAALGAIEATKKNPNAEYHIRKDLNEIEPIIHRHRPTEDLAQEFSKAQNKALMLNKHADKAGMLAGGLGAGLTDYAVNDEYDVGRSAINVIGGMALGRGLKPLGHNKQPAIKSDIERYYPGDTVHSLPKPLSPPRGRKKKTKKVEKADDLRQEFRDRASRRNRNKGKFAPGYKDDK